VSLTICNVDTTKTTTHISLCAGYGGIDLGLKRAIPNLRTVAFSEIEAYAVANLVAKMEQGLLDPAPIWTDLKTFPWEQFRGVVDILSGGFPCQPFSAAGKRQGDEDPRHLFPFILDGIRKCQPKLVFLENVEGIISAKLTGDGWADPARTPVLLHVLRELERVGYRAEAGIFSASEVGAPHQRKRIFILAYDNSQGLQRHISELFNKEGWQEQGRPISSGSRSMADTDSNGGRQDRESAELWTGGLEQPSSHCGSAKQGQAGEGWQVWPSRPGQPQYSWEPPRVVGNATCGRTGGSRDTHSPWQGFGTTGAGADSFTGQSPIESSLGRDPYGTASGMGYEQLCVSVESRVDELRLLGNGVVPQTCTKAFLTLIAKMS
jgi:DNA (cytosine-5)-methyltransferase 1